jgi:S-adenosyl-L-methionine hydrolase (adenosine-forming)
MSIITLTTDFGLSDSYVAVMKAAVLRHAPRALLIDVTHQVPRHDILCGSITLERAIDGFPSGTVHLAVVDPGVGANRRIIVAQINRQTIVCPDNGLITWAWHLHGGGNVHELTWRPRKSSSTFHGRDIMGPAAGGDARRGRVIHVDHFGNATTNISHGALRAFTVRNIRVRGRTVGKLRRTYWDVAPGKPLALIGSAGLLEIAVRDGSAARDLKLKVGDEVVVAE